MASGLMPHHDKVCHALPCHGVAHHGFNLLSSSFHTRIAFDSGVIRYDLELTTGSVRATSLAKGPGGRAVRGAWAGHDIGEGGWNAHTYICIYVYLFCVLQTILI